MYEWESHQSREDRPRRFFRHHSRADNWYNLFVYTEPFLRVRECDYPRDNEAEIFFVCTNRRCDRLLTASFSSSCFVSLGVLPLVLFLIFSTSIFMQTFIIAVWIIILLKKFDRWSKKFVFQLPRTCILCHCLSLSLALVISCHAAHVVVK